MSTAWAMLGSLVLLAGNGFFVAAEFALVASKRYRLEQSAAGGSPAARAALDGSRELSLMLAGAQLGITLCSLGLGALAEPAIEHLLSPLLHAAGLPDAPSHVIAFLVALLIVTFLHLVLGEMMPKSWAITDPERSATLLARPFRLFTRLARPALIALNAMANGTLKLFGVEPQDQVAQAHGPDDMRMLLERSEAEGLLPPEQHELLSSMLKLQQTVVAEVLIPADQLVTIAPGDSAAAIEQASRRSGRSRLAVARPDTGEVVGVVHVREAVRATTANRAVTAKQLMGPPYVLDAAVTVTAAVTAMRAGRAQLALVERDGRKVGFVALEDLLELVIGEFDDETDMVPTGRRMR
jgi:CBS domain containing-hemolysin-like protein